MRNRISRPSKLAQFANTWGLPVLIGIVMTAALLTRATPDERATLIALFITSTIFTFLTRNVERIGA